MRVRCFSSGAAAVTCLLLIMLMPVSGLAKFNAFVAPDIKKSFCGGSRMDYKYCKCAWHNIEQYCKAVGMDQGTAAAYVTNAYNAYVEELRTTMWQNCKNDPNAFWDKAKVGCMRCDPPEVNYKDSECMTPQEICSDDPVVTYDLIKQECTCPPDFKLLSDNTCEKICGEDPHIHFDVTKRECFCDEGWELEEKEGEKYCKELEDILYDVSFEGAQPPLIANGAATAVMHITLVDPVNEDPIAGEFRVEYSNAPARGTVINVVENAVGDYTVTYKTADVTTEHETGLYDLLYIYYESPRTGEQRYKTYRIDLATGVPIEVSKTGFTNTQSAVVFSAPTAKVSVFTLDAEGAKVPVYDAKVAFVETFDFERTGKDGTTVLHAAEQKEGSTVSEVEVVLALDPDVEAAQSKAKKQYQEIVQGERGITNEIVKDFILNFAVYIADLEEGEVQEMIVGLQRTGYMLLYMTEGQRLAYDIAKEAARSVKAQIADTIDLFEVVDAATEKLNGYVGKVGGKAADKLQKLAPGIGEKLGSIAAKFQTGIVDTFKSALKQYAPNFKDEWAGKLFDKLFEKLAGDTQQKVNREQFIKKKIVESSKEAGEGSIEGSIAEYLEDEFDEMVQEGMDQLAEMIRARRFDTVGFEVNVIKAKWNSEDLRNKYLQAHELSYQVSGIKDLADAINDSVIEGAKITGVWKAYAEAVEKAYKAVRTGVINNVEIFYWFRVYGDFMRDVRQNMNEALGVAQELRGNPFVPVAYAQEPEKAVAGNDDADTIMRYKEAKGALGLFEEIDAVTDMLLESFPEDPDLLDVKNAIGTDIREQKAVLDEIGPVDIEEEKDGSMSVPVGITAVIAVVAVILVVVIVVVVKRAGKRPRSSRS